MGSRIHSASLLALGLALGGIPAEAEAEAAPGTPPPPKTRSATPPPPRSAPRSAPRSSTSSPFLPTARQPTSRTPTSPPPPSTTPPPPGSGPPEGPDPNEPAATPQDLSHTWGYSQRSELQPRYVRTHDPTYAAPNPVGFYSGVSVRGNHVPPLPAKDLGATPVEMTWSGFERVGEDGSRVFFQLSSEITYELTESKDGLVLRIRMHNTRVNVRNNRRRLDLRYFKTPMREVRIRHRGKDTVVTVTLERAAIPTVQLVDGKAGYTLLIVEFSGSAPPVQQPASR